MTSHHALGARWAQLAERERRMVLVAITLVGAAMLWWLGLAPALSSLRGAEARHRQLDAQLQQMQTLQAQAKTLQAQPRLSHEEAVRALEASVKQGLGPGARLQIAGERATVTLKGVGADALAQWLTQARVNARAAPSEARLVRSASVGAPTPPGISPTSTSTNAATWDGTLVLSLPPR